MNPEPAAPRHGLLIANLVAQLAFGLLAMTLCLPSMRDWPATFGATQAQVQLSFSGFVAAYGVLQLVFGALSDRHGRKRVLLAGIALAALGSLICALSSNVWMLVLGRTVQGAGAAAGMVIGRAMVQDLFSGPERTRVMAFIGMMMGLCPPTALLLGGQLHVRLGWQANFWLMAAVCAALFAAAWSGLPDVRPQPAARAGGLRALLAGYARLARERAFGLYVVILAMSAATFYTFLGGAPLVLAGYGVPPERIGLYIMCLPVSYIFGNLLTTRLLRVHGDKSLMAVGQGFTLAGIGGVLGLGLAGVHTPLSLALPLLLLGIGHGLLVPPALAGTVGLVPALAGSAAAVAGVTQQLVGAVGGFAVGLVEHDGAVNLAAQMLAWAGLGALAQWALTRVQRASR
jgi:MFS transporter, DHA1 family, multidrug resistance protein